MPLGPDAPTAPPVWPTRRFQQASILRQDIGQTLDYNRFEALSNTVGCGHLCPNTPGWMPVISKKGPALPAPVADIVCRPRLRR